MPGKVFSRDFDQCHKVKEAMNVLDIRYQSSDLGVSS